MSGQKKELSVTAVITGIILAISFGAANAYLGLRVGMTVSASIPAAVVSMGIIRMIMRRESVLENNIVQTIGSAGESVAAGAIFTLPALFMWADEWGTQPPSLFQICLITLCGGLLGVMFMIPLRTVLIANKKSAEELPYPEGTACARVLMAGEEKGKSSVAVFVGLAVALIYKFVADGLKLFSSQLHFESERYKGGGFGVDILPALTGVGYICGYKISSYMLAGGILSWLVLVPAISFFGSELTVFPSETAIAAMDAQQLWASYIRYIGAGAVAVGGIISLVKSMPLIVTTFYKTVQGFNSKQKSSQDLSYKIIIPIIISVVLIIWLSPVIPVSIMGALLIAIFGFFFSAVSSRLVGLVGSSNNPVSGMTIATLIIAVFMLKFSGYGVREGMLGAIAIGSVICIIASVAGDTSQDLKTGFILGATPYKQQIGEIIGVISASIVIGGILYLFNKAWGYNSAELPAPQATLMKLVVEGTMGGNLPWTLVLIGGFIAIVIEILGIPTLPFCIGLYLPIHLSAGIMTGGIIRLINDKIEENADNKGILFASGLIAGEGLAGIILALLAVMPIGTVTFGEYIDLSDRISFGNAGGVVAFAVILWLLYKNRK